MTKTASQEIVLLEPIIEKYAVAKLLNLDEQRELYNEINERVEKDYRNAPAFQTHWEFNEETGINGSNIFRLILANQIRAKKGERTLTYEEGMQLDKQEKLSNGVYRDFGIVVYSQNEPNKEITGLLVEQIKERNLELPVIAHPSSLEIPVKKANNKYGLNITLSDNDSLLVSGEQAREALKKFHAYNSGVCRLVRDGGGGGGAGWGGLAGSGAGGRLDWVRGSATPQNLEAELLSEVDNVANKELEAFYDRIKRAKESALKIIKG